MEYSICKEEQPRQTVRRIKKILSKLGISVSEKIVQFDITKKYAPRSLSVFVPNHFYIGSNGKGSCYINSRASGYSEFMERLQNLIIFKKTDTKFSKKIPDKILFDENQLLNSKINKIYKDKKILKLLNELTSQRDNSFNGKIVMTPWYSSKDKEPVLFPSDIIEYLQGSNGMAAGNTLEEAIVQGLSEICERYVMKYVIYKNFSMPEIQKNEYLKYDNIKRMIDYIESLGLKIQFKDASLGGRLPVVCGVLESPNEDKISIRFGAHPNFPVAVERTITELFQGLEVKSTNEINIQDKYTNYISDIVSNDKIFVFQFMFCGRICTSSKNKLANLFFKNKPHKKNTHNAFLEDGVTYNNKQILKILLNKMQPFTRDEIYIRDVSFLDFPTVYIFIPSMSIINDVDKDELERRLQIYELYISINEKDNIQIEKLFNLVNKYIFKYGFSNNIINYKILLLYSILKKDKKMINFYLNIIKDSHQAYMHIIKDYFKITQKEKYKNIIKIKLLEKYKEKDVDYILKILDRLSIDVISILFLKDKEKKEKKQQYSNKEVDKIEEIVLEAYKNNIPNQNDLKNII